jgi:hypothetical protein
MGVLFRLLRAVRRLPKSEFIFRNKIEYNIIEAFEVCKTCKSGDETTGLCRGRDKCVETAEKTLRLLNRLALLDPDQIRLLHRKSGKE